MAWAQTFRSWVWCIYFVHHALVTAHLPQCATRHYGHKRLGQPAWTTSSCQPSRGGSFLLQSCMWMTSEISKATGTPQSPSPGPLTLPPLHCCVSLSIKGPLFHWAFHPANLHGFGILTLLISEPGHCRGTESSLCHTGRPPRHLLPSMWTSISSEMLAGLTRKENSVNACWLESYGASAPSSLLHSQDSWLLSGPHPTPIGYLDTCKYSLHWSAQMSLHLPVFIRHLHSAGTTHFML